MQIDSTTNAITMEEKLYFASVKKAWGDGGKMRAMYSYFGEWGIKREEDKEKDTERDHRCVPATGFTLLYTVISLISIIIWLSRSYHCILTD